MDVDVLNPIQSNKEKKRSFGLGWLGFIDGFQILRISDQTDQIRLD